MDAGAILDQHRAILRAVRRKQRGAAERAMHNHIMYVTAVRPEEIARVALFLACEDSAFVTGSTVAVDGGMST